MPADPVVSPADTIRRQIYHDPWVKPVTWAHASDCRGCEAESALAALLAVGERDRRQIARLTDLFKPEPYRGVRDKLVCPACGGQGEVSGRNHDDPRWVQCLTCKGDGLSAGARAVLAGEEDAGDEA